METSTTPLRSFLDATALADMEELQRQELVSLRATDTIETGFQTLVKKGVLGAPVKDEATGEFIGLVDIKDFVGYVLLIYGQGRASVSDLDLQQGLRLQSILNLSKTNPFARVSYEASILDALKAFGAGLHRLAVTQDGPSNVVKMVSQMCLLQFLLRNRDKWGGALDGKVGDLKIGSEPRTVSYGEEALTALAIMDREQISGTAIVDDAGRLYGSISTSDLKQASETTEVLTVPLKAFWEAMKKPLVTVSEEDTLGTVIERLVRGRVHRVFVVGADGRPTKVISTTDILTALLALLLP